MDYYIYILKSEMKEITYVGITNDIERRLNEHNSGRSKFTKTFIPWKIIYHENFSTRKDAREREKYLKSAAGRRFIKNTGVLQKT